MESVRFDDFEACAATLLSWEIEAIQLDPKFSRLLEERIAQGC